MGHEFISANDVSRAVVELENNDIDLIITGLEIRGGGGEYFIRQLNSGTYRDIPVIVMTSNDSMEVRYSMFKLGVVDYIPKDRTFEKSLRMFLSKLVEKDKARDLLTQMHIAVLDDSRTQLQVIKNILTLHGISHVDFFTSARELTDSKNEYHIYFLDLVMPDISGEQVILELRQRYPQCVIIAISGIDNYKVISNVLLTGADDYMLKPFNASIFMARLISNVRMYMLVRELKQKNRELQFSLITDPLTKMFNHRYIYQCLVEEVERSQTSGTPLSIMYLSIDNYEAIIDTNGHAAGDKVVMKIADIIKTEAGSTKHCGRYGNVEFIIVVPGGDADRAYDMAERIRKRVSKIRLHDYTLTISGGVCALKNSESAHDLIRMAESLLFNAKKQGKNRIEKEFNWERFL